MIHCTFYEKPGFLLDLVHLGVIQFNPSYAQDTPLSPETAKEEGSFCAQLASRFGDFPNELGLFFRKKDESCYLAERCLKPFLERTFTSDPELSAFLSSLEPTDTQMSVLRYYFPELPSTVLNACVASYEYCSNTILRSGIDDALKLMLLTFCLEPSFYLGLLRDTLTQKSELLRTYCRERSDELRRFRQEFGLTDGKGGLESLSDLVGTGPLRVALAHSGRAEWERGGEIAYTVCRIARYTEDFVWCGDTLSLLLGVWRGRIERGDENHEADFVLLGRVLSEPNRLALLRLLMERGEMCKTEICDLLNLSMTAAQYHVGIMQEAGLLLASSRRRTMYYRLNQERVATLLTRLTAFFQV